MSTVCDSGLTTLEQIVRDHNQMYVNIKYTLELETKCTVNYIDVSLCRHDITMGIHHAKCILDEQHEYGTKYKVMVVLNIMDIYKKNSTYINIARWTNVLMNTTLSLQICYSIYC
jgi:hypothetical protein